MTHNSSLAYEPYTLNTLPAGNQSRFVVGVCGREVPAAIRAGCNSALEPGHLGQVRLALLLFLN